MRGEDDCRALGPRKITTNETKGCKEDLLRGGGDRRENRIKEHSSKTQTERQRKNGDEGKNTKGEVGHLTSLIAQDVGT